MNSIIINKNTAVVNAPFAGIGRLIKTMREGMGLTQHQLSCVVRCTPPLVAAWEQGTQLPAQNSVMRLAALFEITPENLLMGMSFLGSLDDDDRSLMAMEPACLEVH